MKPFIAIIISVLFISPSFAQQDLLPAYPREITYKGDIAYFKGSPFTGLLVDEKTNKRLGAYKNGYKDGIFTEYYTNGMKKSECKYVTGKKDGACTEWFENKQQKSSYVYKNGNIVDGTYAIYLKSGQREKEETYKEGKIILYGKYEDGKLSELLERTVELDSFMNALGSVQKKSEGWLKDGKKEGLWTFWYKHGQKKSEGLYKDGIQEGQWVLWLEDGSINYQGEIKNGAPDGQGTTYDKGKKVYDGEWKNGKKNGRGSYNILTTDGSSSYCTGHFVDDKLVNGTWTTKKIDGTAWTFTGELKNWKFFNGILYSTTSKGIKYTTEYKDGIEGSFKIQPR